jgi:NADH dehydrogenase FAD-containing subunit
MLATIRLAGRLRRQLQRHAQARVTLTLVNAAEVFVERLRLHQVAANQPVRHRPIPDLLSGTGVSFVCGKVVGLNPDRRVLNVETPDGTRPIRYDRLLVALGSTIDRDSVPGVRQHAYVLTPGGPNSALDLRASLAKLSKVHPDPRLTVVGGGPTGLEAAAELAESYPGLRVRLVTQSGLGEFTTRPAAEYLRRSLGRLGVRLEEHTTVTEVRADAVITSTGAVIPHEICLWAGGFVVPTLAREAGLAVNARGQALVDPFLRSISHAEIYAAGDAAHPVEWHGAPVRMAAYTAVLLGAHAADCLCAAVRNRPARPFNFAYAGQAIALGRKDALGFNTFPDDRPHRPYFTGRLGYEVREIFVRLLADLPALERRWPGFFIWPSLGRLVAWLPASRTAQPRAAVHPEPQESSR